MAATTTARPPRRAPRRPRRASRIPPWPRGPKPRRRTELGLLLFGAAITAALYVLASLGAKSKIPPHLGPFLGVLLGVALVAHLANRWLAPQAHPVLLPLAALLNGIGYVIIVRWNPQRAKLQTGWIVVGVLAYIGTLFIVRHSRDLDRYRYLLLLLGGLLMVAPLVPGIGHETYGARLWVHFGSATFQPVELAKVLFCIFFASYFAEKKELLSIPTARVGNRLVVDPRPLVPILVAWGFAMLTIGVENDIGFAGLLFVLFIGMLWIATGRVGYLVMGVLLFVAGAFVAAHFFTQVHSRVDLWLHPGSGTQIMQGWFGLGSGGIGGTGLGQDVAAGQIPELTSDMVFAAIGTEMGLLGTSVVVVAFLLMVGTGLRIAQTARSDFSRLVAAGLTIILGFQAFFIMAGVLRLLPLTGVTLPFVAYGGSSLISNYVLLAILMRVSDEGALTPEEIAAGVTYPTETKFVAA